MWGSNRNVFVYSGGEAGADFCGRCVGLCESTGLEQCGTVDEALFALAPRLSERLSPALLTAPKLGTLVFHPSLLPYRRGPDAIRWTVAAGERVSGVTWFWANERLDEGDICVQEPVLLCPGESAGRAYHTRFIPAGLTALMRLLMYLDAGIVPRKPQDETLATYDGFYTGERLK